LSVSEDEAGVPAVYRGGVPWQGRRGRQGWGLRRRVSRRHAPWRRQPKPQPAQTLQRTL